MKFEELDNLAKELVRYCLNHDNLAVFFNSFDYGKNLIEEHMSNFFLLSDSFLYKNYEFLEDFYYNPEIGLAETEKSLQ